MITSQFIIILSLLVVASYFFDLLNIRIPTVMIQIFFGWIVYLILNFTNYNLPDLQFFLSVLSTIGLFSILFEASMELQFSSKKLPFYIHITFYSLLTILLFTIFFAFFLYHVENIPFLQGMINALPLSIIAGSIAIPSVSKYPRIKEFIIFESAFAGIWGIILLNYLMRFLNSSHIVLFSILYLFQIFVVIFFSIVFIFLFIYVLSFFKKYRIKFIPLLMMILLVFELIRLFELPQLIFIIMLGLGIANIHLLNQKFPALKKKYDLIEDELVFFKKLVSEFTFLIRSMFFITLGYILGKFFTFQTFLENITILTIILVLIYFSRFLILQFFPNCPQNVIFIAPRGLISIALFYSIPTFIRVENITDGTIAFVIIFTALIMSTYFLAKNKVLTE